MTRLAALLAFVVALAPGTVEATGRGDRGPDVVEIQTILASLSYTVKVDGIYGKQTERAVRAWQRSNGLVVDGVVGRITLSSLRQATRVGNQHSVGGLDGRGFAPDGLDNCAEMRFYREQWGLPAEFDGIGWRESNCRNEDSVRTFCCYGYWQNYITSHLSRWSAYRQRIIEQCQVTGADDINSDTPLDKQRQACVTAVVFSISGFSPWKATA
jgi:hypothetical protein